jgi:thioredoxin 1
MALEITDVNFDEIIAKDQVTLVDLWAEWCGPCRAMGPIIDELHTEYAGKAQIGKMNVDDNPVVPSKFNVRGIPTFLIFKNGELVDKLVGGMPKAMMAQKLESHM